MEKLSTELDLSYCDREPIHTPGSIQPHGVLLVVDAGSSRVLQMAGPTDRVLGRSCDRVLGEPLEAVLGDGGDWVRSRLEASDKPRYVGAWSLLTGTAERWDVTAHRRDDRIILEFEPASYRSRSAAEGMASLCQAMDALNSAPGVTALFAAAAREMRRITGFDRVMVYRFLPDGAGAVVAEDKTAALPTLLHHHFPATDIPRQARSLYLRNRFRIIPGANYVPAPLVPAKTGNDEPLDMSDCVLRSVSPVHLRYLKNMGVSASMSVSIVVNNVLWGLIACHHRAAHYLPYDVREACNHLGQAFSRQIEAREEREYQRQAVRLTGIRERILERLRSELSTDAALTVDAKLLRRVVPADGVAVSSPGYLDCAGRTPSESQLHELIGWLQSTGRTGVYSTHQLAADFAPAAAFADTASGLLAIVVTGENPFVALWFRAEQLQVVEWAGNPHTAGGTRDASGQLSPRASFEAWRETVRHTARPWTRAEIDAVRQADRALAELRQQQALQNLNVRLRQALSEQQSLVAQKHVLMQEVHHRVQNSLQIVNSMLQLQARQTREPEVRAQFDGAVHRLMAISSVHQHLWRSSDMQNVQLDHYLEQLCDDLMVSWGDGWAGQVTLSAMKVVIASNTAVTLALIVTELLTNAVKYAYDGQPGPISIAVKSRRGTTLNITVSDRGGGIRQDVQGSGLGSKLIRIFTQQLGGSVKTASDADGTSVAISVPLALRNYAAGQAREGEMPQADLG